MLFATYTFNLGPVDYELSVEMDKGRRQWTARTVIWVCSWYLHAVVQKYNYCYVLFLQTCRGKIGIVIGKSFLSFSNALLFSWGFRCELFVSVDVLFISDFILQRNRKRAFALSTFCRHYYIFYINSLGLSYCKLTSLVKTWFLVIGYFCNVH